MLLQNIPSSIAPPISVTCAGFFSVTKNVKAELLKGWQLATKQTSLFRSPFLEQTWDLLRCELKPMSFTKMNKIFTRSASSHVPKARQCPRVLISPKSAYINASSFFWNTSKADRWETQQRCRIWQVNWPNNICRSFESQRSINLRNESRVFRRCLKGSSPMSGFRVRNSFWHFSIFKVELDSVMANPHYGFSVGFSVAVWG